MDPRLNESERALQERALQAAGTVREAAADVDQGEADSASLVRGLGELLAPAMPGSCGGAGDGDADHALILEEIGAASASVAAATVGHLAAALIVGAADDGSDSGSLFADLLSGARTAALVLDGGASLLDAPSVSVVRSDETLTGVARGVVGAVGADVLVVPARSRDAGDLDIFLVDAGAAGVTVGEEPQRLGLNGSGTATVTLEGAAASASLSLDDPVATLDAAADYARVCLAAVCTGIGRAALEVGTAHVGASPDALDRAQSVQWMLADMATETEAGRLLTWYACSVTDPQERREAAAMARLLAVEAAIGASRRAVQILGPETGDAAIVAGRLYRDAKALELHHGAAESQRHEVARQLLPDLFADATG